jgi:propionyl-CoA carboxylase alpha chain/3-methylcrotonyl-CoA carboxylase alpha subunit
VYGRDPLYIFEDGDVREFSFDEETATTAGGGVSNGVVLSPMPGRITAVQAEAGAAVRKGAPLVTLEAMKMEHALTAPFDGVVVELPVAVGDQVAEGATLARVEPQET